MKGRGGIPGPKAQCPFSALSRSLFMNRSGLNWSGSSYSLSDNEIAQAFQVNTVPAGNLYPSYSSSLINVVGAPNGAIFGRHLSHTSELVLHGERWGDGGVGYLNASLTTAVMYGSLSWSLHCGNLSALWPQTSSSCSRAFLTHSGYVAAPAII